MGRLVYGHSPRFSLDMADVRFECEDHAGFDNREAVADGGRHDWVVVYVCDGAIGRLPANPRVRA